MTLAGRWSVCAGRRLATIVATVALIFSPLVPVGHAELEAPSACTPVLTSDGSDVADLIPFQSTAQGNVFDHGPPRSILLVTSKPDPIAAVVNPQSAADVNSVDLGANVLVGLFIGRWPQVGHRVTIESVRVVGDQVCITAVVVGPGAGSDASDAEEYPYHVVTVPRDAVPPDAGTSWTAVSPDGAILATTRQS